jgi:putative tryptophan/tyrosine transport system substrate-binding protein
MAFLVRLVLILTVTWSVSGLADQQPKIAVIYPETAAPYDKVFLDVQTGIQRALSRVEVVTYQLEKQEPSDLRSWLELSSPDVVITLGSRAAKAYKASGYSAPDIVGASYASPQSNSDGRGIGLSPDPAAVVNLLGNAAPELRRLWVVFNPARDQWAIDQAAAVAAQRSLQLVALEATDLSSAAKRFVEVFQKATPGRDALWVLEDTGILNTRTMMPYIVEKSWARDIPVVSNRLLHAEFGAALSVYPDTLRLGEALGVLALRMAQGEEPTGIKPLSQLRKAMNSRFVSHFGLHVDSKEFDLVFPQP